jgi:hypothetical protein
VTPAAVLSQGAGTSLDPKKLRTLIVVGSLVALVVSIGLKTPSSLHNSFSQDMASYFAQLRCPDGAFPGNTSCAAVQQLPTNPEHWRRADWGVPPVPYYAIDDSVLSGDQTKVTQTWSYSPWGKFTAANGDGGQALFTDGNEVWIDHTQDGSYDGISYFIGRNCGGTGWTVVDKRLGIPSGSWASKIALLRISKDDPSACRSRLDSAYTRWRRENVKMPYQLRGAVTTLAGPTIISEHYNNKTIATSTAMERSLYRGGIIRWEAWIIGRPAGRDLPERCPYFSFSAPDGASGNDWWAPAPGWTLSDCRTYTQIISAPGIWKFADYQWPG